MMIKEIYYSKKFAQQLKKLPEFIQKKAIIKEKLFVENPFHPSLRLHPLKGEYEGIWSMTINMGYRIIFERQENGDILFMSIGKHDIYRNL